MKKREENSSSLNEFDIDPTTLDVEAIEKRFQKKKTIMQCTLVVVFLIAGLLFAFRPKPEGDYIGGNVINVPDIVSSPFEGTIITPWRNASFQAELLFMPLFYTDSSYTEVKPALAEKYDVSNDGLTYTITLRDDMHWSDGEHITAEDVKFSFEGFLSCDVVNSYLASALSNIQGATAYSEGIVDYISGINVNGNQIAITLNKPQNLFPLMLTQFVPLPAHSLGDLDKSTLTSDIDFFNGLNLVSSGQFKVDKYDDEGNLMLCKNTYFADTPTDIEHVILRCDYDNVEIDYHATTDPTKMVSYRSMKGYEEHFVDVLFYRYFLFNLANSADGTGNTAMQDVRVRQAIYHALDVKTLFDEVYFSKGDLYYGGFTSLAEEFCEYNPEKAKQLLIDAGYDFDRTFKICYYSGDVSSRIFLEKVCAYLEAIGLKVEMTKATAASELYEEATYDMLMKNLAAFNTQDWYSEYLSSNAQTNYILGDDTGFDELYDDLSKAPSAEAIDSISKEMLELEQELLYKMPMFLIGEAVYINANRMEVPDDIEFGNTRYFSDMRLAEWSVKKG